MAASQSLPNPSSSQGPLSLSLIPSTERKYLHRGRENPLNLCVLSYLIPSEEEAGVQAR